MVCCERPNQGALQYDATAAFIRTSKIRNEAAKNDTPTGAGMAGVSRVWSAERHPRRMAWTDSATRCRPAKTLVTSSHGKRERRRSACMSDGGKRVHLATIGWITFTSRKFRNTWLDDKALGAHNGQQSWKGYGRRTVC